MAKQKQDKPNGGGWHFPAALEIIKCKEGNKEFIKERTDRGGGRRVLICEYPLSAVAEFDDEDARVLWRLAKRSARDFLRNSWITAAVVKAIPKENAVRVYGKY